MDTIRLNFINRSNDRNNSTVLIFQKNAASDFDEIAVAWTVIENCAAGWHHQLDFPLELKISAADAWGNEIIEPLPAEGGNLFQVYRDQSGDQLSYVGPGSSAKEVQLNNSLSQGSIDAKIYRAGNLLAVKTGIAPGQKAVFEFKPTIMIGVVSQIQEGDVINSAIISDVNTEISLLGLKSADIVMRGGGTGEAATEFQFTLENVIYA